MEKILFSLLPFLIGSNSSKGISGDELNLTLNKATQEAKATLNSLLALLAVTLLLSGLVIFSLIRLVEKFELYLKQYEYGEQWLTVGYVVVVCAGIAFITYLFKKKNTVATYSVETSPSVDLTISPEGIVSSLMQGFSEGLQKGATQREVAAIERNRKDTYEHSNIA